MSNGVIARQARARSLSARLLLARVGVPDAATIGPADRVLDIGCGTGRTTRDAARRASAGRVLGLDLGVRYPSATWLVATTRT